MGTVKRSWSTAPERIRRTRLLTVVRWILTLGILAYLAVRLTRVGWAEIWAALPVTPWFYAIFLAMYFLLPVTEALAYGLIWQRPARLILAATIRKKVYNQEFINWSGEVALYSWARRTHGASDEAFHGVKDNTIVASMVSIGFAVVVLVALMAGGLAKVPVGWAAGHRVAVVSIAVIGAVVAAVVTRYRRVILTTPRATLARVAGLHLGRLVLVHVLQVAQWAVVLPWVPLDVWLTFLAVQIIVVRLPFVPSRDFLFVGVGVGMAGALDTPEAAITGLLLAASALERVLNLTAFAVASWMDRVHGEGRGSDPPVQAEPPLAANRRSHSS